MRRVAIVGVGMTKHGRRRDVSMVELIREAVEAVLTETDVEMKDIDAISTGSMPALTEGINAAHVWSSDALGCQGKPVMRVATCGTTGMSIAHLAYYHVASGLYDLVLAVGFEKMTDGPPQATLVTVADPYYQRPFVTTASAASMIAVKALIYKRRYNAPEEASALVAVKNRSDAFRNPYAHLKMELTVDKVLESPYISYPLRLHECCPVSDGACAVLFASEEIAPRITPTPAWVAGLAYFGDEGFVSDKDPLEGWMMPLREAAKKAYRMAGIHNPRKELDVVESYNAFTWQELMEYEGLGLCGPGEAPKLVQDGVTWYNGELPVCPSGGVLSTNAIGDTGLVRVGEAALQVMGKARGHQVTDVETALGHAWGGMIQFHGVMILSKNRR